MRHTAIDMRDPDTREYVLLATLKGGVRLESKGMKLSRGPSCTSRAKAALGLGRGTKPAAVLEAVEKRMEELLQKREEELLTSEE